MKRLAQSRADKSGRTPWHLVELGILALHKKGLVGEGVRIGVIDTGVARHPDLPADQIEALDSQGPGFDGSDHKGHGTGVIGILLGAQGAVCPKAHVVSVRATTGAGPGDVDALVAAINRLMVMDVDLISISMGTRAASNQLATCIDKAAERGVVVVAAAEDGPAAGPLYPGFYAVVVGVTAVDGEGKLLFPRVPAWVDVAAPGREIETLGLTGRLTMDGTSPATAICTGVAALLLGMAPKGEPRRELGRHMLGLFSQVPDQPSGAHRPGDPRLLVPRKLQAAVAKMLAST